MVWVVEGSLNSAQGDAPDAVPHPSSHYLRPTRLYRVGRAGGVRAPPKAGQTKPGPASRAKPYDFRIASLSVPKEGLAVFETGGDDWDPVDHPDSASNLDPYRLTVSLHKKFTLDRAGETIELASGVEGVEVRDGDKFRERSKGYWFTFRWKPINLCLATATTAQKKDHAAVAKFLGIKVAYREFRAHHTHWIAKSVSPSASAVLAAMRFTPIVSPAWFASLSALGAPPPFPSEVPGPRPVIEEGEDATAYERRVTRWEKDLLELEPDVGADSERHWGHCALELDWDGTWPAKERDEYLPAPWEGHEPRLWRRDERRKTLFEGVLVVAFQGEEEADETQSLLVTLGGGSYFPCTLLHDSVLPSSATSLVSAIDTFKKAQGARIADAPSRVVVLPPADAYKILTGDEPDEERDERMEQQVALVQELQRLLGLGKVCNPDGHELAEAIYKVDTAPLFAAEQAESGGGGASSSRAARTQGSVSTQFTQATPPFPTGGVPGTHPDSGMPAPQQAEAGPSGMAVAQEDTGEESAPSQPRKLVRRARTGRNAVESLLGDLEPEPSTSASANAASSSARPITQRARRVSGDDSLGSSAGGVGGTLGSTQDPAGGAMDVDAPAVAPTTTTRRRRAGAAGRSAVDALLEADSPEKGGGAGDEGGTQSMHEGLMKMGKTRAERMAAIEEADRRLALEEREEAEKEREKAGKGKGRARDQDEVDDGADGGRRKKREKSVAFSDPGDEDDEDGPPARKRSSKKSGDAPVSNLKKRTRAASREPSAGPAGRARSSSSSSEDESARASRKKAKTAAAAPPSPPAPPKNKKEAAAQKKAEKEAREREQAKLLQVKPTKRKGAEVDQAFNDDFNALKIVRPVLKAMPVREKHRMNWNEEDSDVERDRLIETDHQRLAAGDESDGDMDPDNWRRPTQAMFVIRTLDVERKERPAPRTDDNIDERWAGRPNFKKFRPKNSKNPREPLAKRPQIELVLPEAVDFGLGPGYNDRKGTAFSQVQAADDEDDEDEMFAAMTTSKGQSKLDFSNSKKSAASSSKAKAKTPAKAKGKSKSKQIVSDSDNSDDLGSSHTLRDDDMDVDELEDDPPPARASKKAAPAKRSAATRKPAVATIMIDESSSESDSGLTFKGFGKKGATGRARR
ncbi:uncharacterized protein JCM10292_007236 [Rhodotorula paludigena]|uniref:uncharacterized protein n=1 Tax=Rhodotorula paludigena TaxID=86838 RepID=UPI00317CDA8C